MEELLELSKLELLLLLGDFLERSCPQKWRELGIRCVVWFWLFVLLFDDVVVARRIAASISFSLVGALVIVVV